MTSGGAWAIIVRMLHCFDELIDWRALFIAFIASAGYHFDHARGIAAGDWIGVAEQAREHDAWFWEMPSGK